MAELLAYCDGGVIGRNPSPEGGTWSWCHVGPVEPHGEQIVSHEGGTVTPADIGLGTITNNLTELLAAVECLEALPDGWTGTLYTDSLVTLRRVHPGTKKPKYNGIPSGLVERVATQKKRLGAYKVVLLGGHPTREDLARGRRDNASGPPVSRWNVWCDERCKSLASRFRREQIEARYAAGR